LLGGGFYELRYALKVGRRTYRRTTKFENLHKKS
jgi:hypothetical protein